MRRAEIPNTQGRPLVTMVPLHDGEVAAPPMMRAVFLRVHTRSGTAIVTQGELRDLFDKAFS